MTEMFPKEWFIEGVREKGKHERVIDTDKWDEEDHEKAMRLIPPYVASRRQLGEFTPTGKSAMEDTYFTFLKAQPHTRDEADIKPSHAVNRAVITEMQDLNEVSRLRFYSVGDDVQAALSASTVEPDLETLFDRLKSQQDASDELRDSLADLADAFERREEAEHDLDDMIERMKAAADDPGDSDEADDGGEAQAAQAAALAAAQAAQAAAQAAYEEAQATAQGLADDLEKDLHQQQPTINMALQGAVGRAADEAQASNEAAACWGLSPGELQHLPAQERMALAKKLSGDRFRRIADLFGPMKNLMLSEQQRRTTHSHEEIYDIELGDDLSRVVPSELQKLGDPLLKLDFMQRYADHALPIYAMQGQEKLSRGGIILCEDGSGSMRGEREMWAKAFMLCLLHLARQQNRTMHLLHFGSRNQITHIGFVKPEDFTIERIIEAAEVFYGGGTHFETPMAASIDILSDEFTKFGSVRADVVFVTDDDCQVESSFMTNYLAEMERLQSTTWGIGVAGRKPVKGGALHTMCDGKVAGISDFLSGDEVRFVFRGV